jgi:hypothetical protein
MGRVLNEKTGSPHVVWMSVVADVGSEPHAPLTTLRLGDAATLLGMAIFYPI